MAACIPAVILSTIQKDEDYRRNVKWMKEGSMVLHYSYLASSDMAINEIRFLGLFNYIKNNWRNLANTYISIKNKMTRKHVLYNSIADILRNCIYIAVLLIAAYEIYEHPSIGLGTFMLVFTLSSQLQDVTAQLLINAAQFFSDIKYMRDFFEIEKLESEKTDTDAKPVEKADIEFCNVGFSYPNTNLQVLKKINVRIKQGEKIAIVGENGSGKTTFTSLLCGMYEPDEGQIKINGIDIKKDLTALRRSMSVVFQDFARYEATIRENITVSDKNKLVNDDELYKLTKKAGSFEIVNSQPDKLDEIVGTFSQHGNNLSGGQWQKIAITRALYRDNAKILVLDEPTSALDPIAEAALYRDFAALTGDKTTILISHRLGITSVVDRILVFDNGSIVEDGSHKELISLNGLYAKMYQAQAQWYIDSIDV
jgi:ATP-binding cassette subfamily B protein